MVLQWTPFIVTANRRMGYDLFTYTTNCVRIVNRRHVWHMIALMRYIKSVPATEGIDIHMFDLLSYFSGH